MTSPGPLTSTESSYEQSVATTNACHCMVLAKSSHVSNHFLVLAKSSHLLNHFLSSRASFRAPSLSPTFFPSRPTPSFPSPSPASFPDPFPRSRRRRRYPAPEQHTTGAGSGRRHCCDRATGGLEPALLLACRYQTPAPQQTTRAGATAATSASVKLR